MKHARNILLLLALVVTATMWGQRPPLPYARHKAVYGTDWYVSPSHYDYTFAAREIVGDAASQYEKAQRLYLWLCHNVTYDQRTSGDGARSVRTADETWTLRTAVCQGYCELFYRMAEAVGLRSHLVFGRCKHATPGAPLEDHTWLTIETEEGDILADPTWGAARLSRSRRGDGNPLPAASATDEAVQDVEALLWFDVEPAWFVFTHQPKNLRHQHLDVEVSDEQFARMPYVTPRSALLGLGADDVLSRWLTDGEAPPRLVEANGEWLGQLQLVSIPPVRRLPLGQPVTFVVEKSSDDFLVQIAGDGEHYGEHRWTCDAGRMTLTLTPEHAGRLVLAVTPRRGVPVLKRLVEYEVTAPER